MSNELQREVFELEAKFLALAELPQAQQTEEIKKQALEIKRKYRMKVEQLAQVRRIEALR